MRSGGTRVPFNAAEREIGGAHFSHAPEDPGPTMRGAETASHVLMQVVPTATGTTTCFSPGRPGAMTPARSVCSHQGKSLETPPPSVRPGHRETLPFPRKSLAIGPRSQQASPSPAAPQRKHFPSPGLSPWAYDARNLSLHLLAFPELLTPPKRRVTASMTLWHRLASFLPSLPGLSFPSPAVTSAACSTACSAWSMARGRTHSRPLVNAPPLSAGWPTTRWLRAVRKANPPSAWPQGSLP